MLRPRRFLLMVLGARADQSMCYGFALFESVDDARAVVAALHRKRVGNKTLMCKLARSVVNLLPSPSQTSEATNRLFVRGFPASFTDGTTCSTAIDTGSQCACVVDLVVVARCVALSRPSASPANTFCFVLLCFARRPEEAFRTVWCRGRVPCAAARRSAQQQTDWACVVSQNLGWIFLACCLCAVFTRRLSACTALMRRAAHCWHYKATRSAIVPPPLVSRSARARADALHSLTHRRALQAESERRQRRAQQRRPAVAPAHVATCHVAHAVAAQNQRAMVAVWLVALAAL